MNKAEFVAKVAARTGDKKAAQEVLDVALDEIQRAVSKGQKVSFAGFGVFEKRARAARMARNPRTGEAVRVKKTNVPAFRPGQNFKELVTGQRKPVKLAKKAAKKSVKKTTATKAAKKSTPRKAAKKTTRAATTGRSAAKKAAKRATAKKTAKKAAAKKTTRKAAKKATRKIARKTTATKAAKKAGARKKATRKASARGRR